MPPLKRLEVIQTLDAAGWPFYMTDLMVAIAAQESSLYVNAEGPTNKDGTTDYGLFQINSRYVTGAPYYNINLLLTDAIYNAKCAYAIFKAQGLRAWAAYNSGEYIKFLPPHLGGPEMSVSAPAWFLVADLQHELNIDLRVKPNPLLVVDGVFGRKTQAALKTWQAAYPPLMDGTLRPIDSLRLIP